VSWQDFKGTLVIDGCYTEAIKMMNDISFLSALMNFPKQSINDETVELLKPYFASPDFNYDAAKKVSGNCLRRALCCVVPCG
jgi:dynein heavy chain, axonemal